LDKTNKLSVRYTNINCLGCHHEYSKFFKASTTKDKLSDGDTLLKCSYNNDSITRSVNSCYTHVCIISDVGLATDDVMPKQIISPDTLYIPLANNIIFLPVSYTGQL